MSSSSDWEEIPSGAQSDSPSGSRRRSKRHGPGTNNASDVLLDSRDDDSPINSQLRSSSGGGGGGVVPRIPKQRPPRNESFTMIDTPRGPRDRNLQAHSVTLPPAAAVVGGSTDESPSPQSPDQQGGGIITNPTGLPPRPPLHNNPPSPMAKKQPAVTILDDAFTPQQTTPSSLEQRSPGIANSAFPQIPPPRTNSQGSVNNPHLNANNNPLPNNTNNIRPHLPLGVFPSAASMDSLVGGPQSLHFSPNTPQQQGQWKDVTGVGGAGGPTPGSSMSADCTPYRTYQGGDLLGMGSRHDSSNWGDAPSQSCESAPRDSTANNENSAVRNHQASLFSSVLAGFDERSKERSNSPPVDAAKNEEPEGSENHGAGGAAPQAAPQEGGGDVEEGMEGLTNQPTSEFREASMDRSPPPPPPQKHSNKAAEARAKAAEQSRKATVDSLTSAPTPLPPAEDIVITAGIAVRTVTTPPAVLRQHRWRPYLLRVYRWQTPRHSLVAVALVVSLTTIVLPAIFVGIGPFRFALFGFALMQMLSGALLLLAGVPQLRPLFVRLGVLESSTTSSSSTSTAAPIVSSETSRKQAQKFIAKTIKTKASTLYDQSNLHDAIPQFGGYLWDKLLELADPTEAIQGEHEAAIKIIHSDRKRRQSLQQLPPQPNRYLDPFANVQQEEESNEEDEEAMETLLQQSAYFDSAAISAAAAAASSSSSSSQEDEQKKKLATMEGLVQEALRTERHALAKKLFLMLAAAIVVIEPILDWAVNDASSPTSTFLFLLGVFICGRYPIRKILRREYIRHYGVTAGPFTQRTTTTTTTTPASPQATKPTATSSTLTSSINDQKDDATINNTSNHNKDDEDENDPQQL